MKHDGLPEQRKGEERGRKAICFPPVAENLVAAGFLLSPHSAFVLSSHGSGLLMADWLQTKLPVATCWVIDTVSIAIRSMLVMKNAYSINSSQFVSRIFDDGDHNEATKMEKSQTASS